jgi:ABC-2 type transport system permease protein
MMRALTLSEARLLLREPLALFWGLAFPMLLLSVMGLSAGDADGVPLVVVYLPIVIALSAAAIGVQGLPAHLAGYRERRVLRRLATTPAGPFRVIGAQLIVSSAVIVVAAAGCVAVERLGFGAPLPGQLAGFAVVTALTAAAMLGLGLLIGALAPTGRAAAAAGVLLFFPLMYFAGLWTPQMPPTVQHVAHFTPLGAAAQGLRDTMAGQWPQPVTLAVLAGCAVACTAMAARFFRWD